VTAVTAFSPRTDTREEVSDLLSDSYLDRLPFHRHSDSDQEQLPFLVTADGRQSFWATNALNIMAQETLGIWVKRNATRFACLTTAYRNGTTSYVEITKLQIARLLHT
jgi:hypothetical protein